MRDLESDWDTYARFYDWENARTLGQRDVRFWCDLTANVQGPILELGCGTGRVTKPLVESGAHVVGVDLSRPMLRVARRRLRRVSHRTRWSLVEGNICALPFARRGQFDFVMAPYGILQSLLSDQALTDALSEARRVLKKGGTLGVDLVPDVPQWQAHPRRVSLRGRRGSSAITLFEAVRQDTRRRLTHFDQEFVERNGSRRRVYRFSLTFRTLSFRTMTGRIERAGFRVDAVLGGYTGEPLDEAADAWLILARRV
jgi:ubiquinone/menaquinone biosynthesis C-methylase UbiE